MKIITLILVFIASITLVTAQNGPYLRVKFKANEAEFNKILRQGIDAEGIIKENNYYIAELSTEEYNIVKATTSTSTILISDMSKYYFDRAQIDIANNKSKKQSATPPGFQLGIMGGFLNYAQIVQTLDSMHRRYPSLVSAKKSIGNTLENRPTYVVKISDHPNKDEAQEKQVLYDAMHHAREPQAMMQMIYFMWYILDRYEQNDPIAQYIINNRELYFIPIVNPDGYFYNESISPGGTGMWRKNRRLNAGGSIGVDLNRNYGVDWGFDDVGSSPFGNSNTFRGASAFSEPETQNMRDFVNSKKIKVNLSYHTFGGYLIYPFGAKENYYTPDSNMFRLYADSLTKDNGYSSGTVFETLSYFANGGSCDWMYADTSHSKIFSFTPEVGFSNDGFWPVPSRIIPLCEENIAPNLFLAKYAVNALDIITKDTTYADSMQVKINVDYFSAGLENNKSITSYIEIDTSIINFNTDTFTSNGINTFTKISKEFNLSLKFVNQKLTVPYRIVSIVDGIKQYDSAILVIDKAVGLLEKKNENKIKIYPNPSTHIINIDFDINTYRTIHIYSMDGKLLISSKQKQIDVSYLKRGNYFLSIKEGNKILGIETFQKE